MSEASRVTYSEVPAADVAAYFIRGYQIEGEKVKRGEWFYDSAKSVFIFRLELVPEAQEVPPCP